MCRPTDEHEPLRLDCEDAMCILSRGCWRATESSFRKPFAPLAPQHAVETDNDEGQAEQLALVQPDGLLHGQFPRLLHFLEKFHQQAEGEDGAQAVTEEEALPHPLFVFAVEPQADNEKEEVGHGLIELAGMARQGVAVLHKHKAVIGTGELAHDFGVHQVAHAYHAGGNGRGHGNVVEHAHEVHLVFPHIEPQGYHQADGATVGSKSGIARELPAAVGQVPDGEHHLDGVRQEVGRLIEQAMTQTRTDQDAHKAIDEQGLKLLGRDLLTLIEFQHHHVGQCQPDTPTDAVPPHAERAQRKDHLRRIPNDSFR